MQDLPFKKLFKGLQFGIADIRNGPVIEVGLYLTSRYRSQPRNTLDDAVLVTEKRSEELLALDEALERLTAHDPRKSRIVELRYFGGLTEEETAAFLKLSHRTVRREWRMARTWLYRALSGKEPDEI